MHRRLRWPLLSIAVGIVAGVGAITFDWLLHLFLKYFIHLPTGYIEPVPIPAGTPTWTAPHFWGRWLLLIIPTLGGLVSGLIVFLIAPEAEGDGTNAMIESFHQRGGFVRKRVPFLKILSSAITIGSGGSAGKEGPISQIGSGFGSCLASALHLRPRDRRILMLAGAAAGIGAIFRAPLGAALFAPEVLYRDTEFESEAILPCLTSSIVAYSIFTNVYGRQALFFPGHVDISIPTELVPYTLFGVVCALVGYFYVHWFYGLRDKFFNKLPLPNHFKPAIGGFLLGCVALFYPQIMAGGYGWIQYALEGKFLWHTMFILAILKIVVTSFTISSGGSGGVFGPSLFMGAMLGGAFGFLGHQLAPQWVINPTSYVLVGMGAFLGGVGKIPIASIIMLCEMSSSYTLLVPLMLVTTIAFLCLWNTTLYEKQVATRMASPAHFQRIASGLLERMFVYQAVNNRPVELIPESMPFEQLVRTVTNSPDHYFPVIDQQGKMTGILSINDIRGLLFEEAISHLIVAKDVATPNVVRLFWNETLKQALDKFNVINVDELPVVKEDSPDQIITMLSKRDIISFYYQKIGV
ncbi:MAG: chloride channel protein [Desulfobacca sp. 4484_104]|nr:MAG: chloride channel protein [Desulfobacca sp. 4484_104]